MISVSIPEIVIVVRSYLTVQIVNPNEEKWALIFKSIISVVFFDFLPFFFSVETSLEVIS